MSPHTYPSMVVALALSFSAPTLAQDPSHKHDPSGATKDDPSMLDQLAELRARIARLEGVLEQNHQGSSPATNDHDSHPPRAMGGSMGDMGMSMMGRGMARSDDSSAAKMSMGMGMMGMMRGGMSGMGKNSRMSGMGKKSGMSGIDNKAALSTMVGKVVVSDIKPSGNSTAEHAETSPTLHNGDPATTGHEPLPSFQNAPGLYHVGSTGFFLDLPDLALDEEQGSRLRELEAQNLRDQQAIRSEVERLEQKVFAITGSPSPNSETLIATIREIEEHRLSMRWSFIQAVGAAASVLTDEQRAILTQGQ